MFPIRSTLALILSATVVHAIADESAHETEARLVASELVQKLGGELRKALQESGPGEAISVCRDAAPRLAGELSRRTGWRITRVSLRTRNPLLGQPDGWEQQTLQSFDARVLAGEKAESLELAEAVDEPGGRYFRFMKALPVQPACLSCHGSDESISNSVRERLALDYPNDRATGYRIGEVRGAVSIKRPLPAAD